ncbi:hypothetical protein JYU14_05305 [Simkania negevensis]|uniref:Uncharacterized protein n=1 Tax=Simkania negevensis TaxID=83561 RepID=A0ABS3ASY2_9BACT|nr:hypothetical protein [Simkania negevensis]
MNDSVQNSLLKGSIAVATGTSMMIAAQAATLLPTLLMSVGSRYLEKVLPERVQRVATGVFALAHFAAFGACIATGFATIPALILLGAGGLTGFTASTVFNNKTANKINSVIFSLMAFALGGSLFYEGSYIAAGFATGIGLYNFGNEILQAYYPANANRQQPN